jgi:hypothetical protein
MNAIQAITVAGMMSVALFAAEKPNFSGVWRMDSVDDDSAKALKIDQSEQVLRISRDGEQDKPTDISCNTVGKDCEATVDGQRVKVSYWYNGPVLVEMVFEGKNNERVIKTRRTLSEDGQTMMVEVIPMVPSGQSPEKLVFVRDQQVAAAPAADPDQQ